MLIKQEIQRKSGYAIQVEEEHLRVQLDTCQSELNAPTQFKVRPRRPLQRKPFLVRREGLLSCTFVCLCLVGGMRWRVNAICVFFCLLCKSLVSL